MREEVVMAPPTWNGEPVAEERLASVRQESFELLTRVMRGEVSTEDLSLPELLHVVEAGSHLEAMAVWTRMFVLPRAREAGASWAMMAMAMGVPRSTAQSRYKSAPGGLDG
jgi:hypothetical protein